MIGRKTEQRSVPMMKAVLKEWMEDKPDGNGSRQNVRLKKKMERTVGYVCALWILV